MNKRYKAGYLLALATLYGLLSPVLSIAAEKTMQPATGTGAGIAMQSVTVNSADSTERDAAIQVSSDEPISEHLIGPMDLLEVKVLQADEISRNVRVDARGNISLPLIGIVKAAELTSYQLEQSIAARLAVDLIQNPQVSVFIKEYTSQHITITVQGLINRTGMYEFHGKATLLQAISMGGGISEKGNERAVKIVRKEHGKNQTLTFDLYEIRNDTIPDPELKNNDIVMVEEIAPITVEGAVVRPGVVYPRNRPTLMQMISNSGGLNDMADPAGIKVFTTTSTGTPTTINFDLNQIRDGKMKDPDLKHGDLIVVERSFIRTLLRDVSGTLRGFIGYGPLNQR